ILNGHRLIPYKREQRLELILYFIFESIDFEQGWLETDLAGYRQFDNRSRLGSILTLRLKVPLERRKNCLAKLFWRLGARDLVVDPYNRSLPGALHEPSLMATAGKLNQIGAALVLIFVDRAGFQRTGVIGPVIDLEVLVSVAQCKVVDRRAKLFELCNRKGRYR